jgi:uncharacterized protein
MDPLKIIKKYYAPESVSCRILLMHSMAVAEKALKTAARVKHMRPDTEFIRESALLHDIGIFMTDEPKIGCHGKKKYICHGYLGREILEKEGFPRHALVCERHIGAGITIKDIEEKNLPIPKRDMIPLSVEEQIICFADKFFSKDAESLQKEKPLETVRAGIAKFGDDKLKRFDKWLKLFGNY